MSASGSNAAQTAKLAPLVIGVELAETGTNGNVFDPSADVATAWEDWVNEDLGGIQGHPVKLVILDDKDNPTTSLSVASQLITQDHVIAEVGGEDGGEDQLWMPQFAKAKIPVVAGGILEPNVAVSSPYIFSVAAAVDVDGELQIDAAKSVGTKRLVGVNCAESPACAGITTFWKSRATQLNVPYDGYEEIAAATPSYTAVCLKLQRDGDDTVLLGLNPAVAIRFIQDCKEQGYDPYYNEPGSAMNGTLLAPASEAGAKFVTVLQDFPWWLDTPAVENYRNVLEKYSPAHTVPESQLQTATWASLELFRQAMSTAKISSTPTSANVYDALTQVKNDNLGGLLPQKISFTAGQPSPRILCGWDATFDDNKFGGGTVTCLSS